MITNTDPSHALGRPQHLAIDESRYFFLFLCLGKSEVRRTVHALERRFPDDDPRTRVRYHA